MRKGRRERRQGIALLTAELEGARTIWTTPYGRPSRSPLPMWGSRRLPPLPQQFPQPTGTGAGADSRLALMLLAMSVPVASTMPKTG